MYLRSCKRTECNSKHDQTIILLNELYGKKYDLIKR